MKFSARTAIAVAVLSLAAVAAAADYPVRPIRMIVPQAPGSASDNVARLLAGALTQQLNQQVVVDNRPGGALMIGMEMTARAAPDGYTIGYSPIGALAISPNIVRGTVTVDVLKDLQPISQTTTGHMLLAASPATPFKSVRELIDSPSKIRTNYRTRRRATAHRATSALNCSST
jgi:tripartite-type tricarboxylate transporter receptor subunit TctC